ncbi:O-antigen ligase family protein [Sulfuricella denitrificans]|uniref:O-antigen ligase family protein n=1 Tax=Sulfuricella denitrificans TaxID=649841 RepID=UPI0002FAD31B|nr:O-antigen ligase family protein [Sulfuricella denitrificans]
MLSNNVSNTIASDISQKSIVVNKSEKARRKVVKYVFWIYWLLLFEGALRKWVFPELQELIFFARDPIVLLVYFVAWRYHIVKRDGLLTAGVIIAFIFIPLMFVQIAIVDMNIFTLVYGWRMYFMYLPLMFVIKDAFNHEDIYKLIRQSLYVSIPLSVLVYFQYISPPHSFINQAYSTGHVFIVANNIVRTTGTFSFTAGQTMFSASLIAMIVFAWLYRKSAPLLSLPWLVMATGSSVTTLLLTGSRTAFFLAGLVVLATFFGLSFTKGIKRKLTGALLLFFLLCVGAFLFMGPFKDSFDALSTRVDQADKSEGTANRAFSPFTEFFDVVLEAPLVGYGLGFGTSGGSKLALGKTTIVLPENEWPRVVMEVGPAFGILYIGYRVFFTLIIFGQCIRCARTENLLPMILLGFIGFYMLAGNITGTGTIHGYNWIFVGLVMAAARKQTQRQVAISRNRGASC